MSTAPAGLTENVESIDRQGLADAILALEADPPAPTGDDTLDEALAAHLRPLEDELAALRAGASGDGDETVADQGGDAADGDGKRPRRRRKGRADADVPTGPEPDLMALPPKEQARWIFMERYVSLERHEEILGLSFDPDTFAEHQESFDRLIKDLLLLPRSLEAAEANDIQGLQKVFASCVPVFRYPEVGVGGDSDPSPASIEHLRRGFPSYFYRRRNKPNWFERQDFYTEAVPGPRWVLCETEYLNCTLRRPAKKLGSYAGNWDLPSEYAEQKSAVEDVYDRIVVGEALGENLLAGNCNAITTTRYRTRRKGARRLVYTVQKVHKITIHGKPGIPHWRAKRRLWPGVHPTLAFPDTP